MEAKPFQLSPMGHDIISKHKGQWFCPELRQKKQCGTPETIVPFGIGYFFFSDVKIYWFLKSSFIWKSSIVWYLRSWPLDVNCLTVTPTPLYTSADDLKLYNLSLPQLQNENDRTNIIGLLWGLRNLTHTKYLELGLRVFVKSIKYYTCSSKSS